MGTSRSYHTIAPVSDDVRSQIVAELTAVSDTREWWSESISLFESHDLPGHACGDTRLFSLIDDDLADCYMATQDGEFIVRSLEIVSAKHAVDWQLLLAGEDAGRIVNGQRDSTVNEMLSSFTMLLGEMGDFASYSREQLLRQYHDR